LFDSFYLAKGIMKALHLYAAQLAAHFGSISLASIALAAIAPALLCSASVI
jgi:hypothetical protein